MRPDRRQRDKRRTLPAPATPPARPPVWNVPDPLPAALAPTPEFLDAAAKLGLEFDAGDVERLGLYLSLLFSANESLNLTAVTDKAQAWTRHILDSLTLLPILAELPDQARVIDVGSGAGLPGLPLAIAMPHLRFSLLEATQKKADFLRSLVGTLSLANVEVLADRAERAAHDRGERTTSGRAGGHREQYDAAIARAVGPLAVVAELTAPFAKVGGQVLLIKGQKAEEELASAKRALHELHVVHSGTVDTPTGRIVVLEKPSATPRTYPRADGEPKRSPLH